MNNAHANCSCVVVTNLRGENREHVEKICSEPFQKLQTEGSTHDKDGNDEALVMIARIQDQLFSPAALNPTRWAASSAVQEPDCVSWDDHGLGSAPLENIRIINDLDDEVGPEAEDDEDEKAEEIGDELVRSTLETRHLSRRERGLKKQHHHHHHKAQKRDVTSVEEPSLENDRKVDAEAMPLISIRADTPSAQGTYAINKDEPKVSISKLASADKAKNVDDSRVLVHENLGHSDSKGEGSGQRVLIQGGSGFDNVDPVKSVENLGKASEGHPVDKDAAKAEGEAKGGDEEHTKKGTVLLAAVPILLVMGAIAGFTIYRRYYENNFNQGGRNDSMDDHPNNGYHQRDLPIRKGSPIHFDRTFLNTIHSPPPTATYLHDPDSPSRNHSHYNTQNSPQSIAAGNSLKRPTPSAGSVGKNRFQELSRSYDFSAGLRSIKNALTRSNNNSREGALNQAAASGSGSAGSLSGRNSGQYAGAFGAGGHSIAKIGSHPGLNALERQQLQAQFGSGTGSSSTGAAARFPDASNVNATQEHSIVWGQYSANDEHDVYQDANTALASNLGAARKSGSTNSLTMLNSGGKYSHHHRQRSSDRQQQQQQQQQRAGSPRDSIGDCLSPESPSMLTREELMRRRDLYSEGYAFTSETASIGEDDTHSGTNLLFDARDHFFDLAGSGAEKIAAAAAAGVSAQMIDEEMDMYLEMEKEESPFAVDDYNSMNPLPYEPKVLTRQMLERRQSIQKTAALREKEISEKPSEKVAVNGAGNNEAAAKLAKSQSKKDRRKLAKQSKKQQLKQVSGTGKMEQEVFDEKRAMEAQEAAVVTDTEAEPQTHVLGCDSPDWRE
ncbi:hypothetical protein BGZ96_009550 [Linnemannia gamsii]|uniref:Uncharacterized protein n=1 Tax=Linnemannia gamsii TaxID=64522 RepID=A0ABQ7JW00_9FUNG|nr:hypothetical protein BGZ96_009550 [Linnemannia gamsii]